MQWVAQRFPRRPAVSFAVLATPVLAETGTPYEQLDVDRALPNVAEAVIDSSAWQDDHNLIAPAL